MSAKVLIIHDYNLAIFQSIINQAFKKQIKAEKYEFYFVANIEEALKKLQFNSHIDIIIIDIKMPETGVSSLFTQTNKLGVSTTDKLLSLAKLKTSKINELLLLTELDISTTEEVSFIDQLYHKKVLPKTIVTLNFSAHSFIKKVILDGGGRTIRKDFCFEELEQTIEEVLQAST